MPKPALLRERRKNQRPIIPPFIQPEAFTLTLKRYLSPAGSVLWMLISIQTMKRPTGWLPVLLLWLLSSGLSFAQITVFTGYERLDVGYWNFLDEGNILLKDGYTVGLSSDIDLANGAVQLIPAVSFSHFRHAFLRQSLPSEASMAGFTFSMGLRLFPLFIFDCENCETLRQGLFVQPELGYSVFDLQLSSLDFHRSQRVGTGRLGFQSGFVLHYSPRLSIAPVFHFQYIPDITWEGLSALRTPATDEYFRENTSIQFHSFEIQVRYRWKAE